MKIRKARNSVQTRIEALYHQFELDLKNVRSMPDTEALRIKYLGRKGPIQELMKNLRGCSSEERPLIGKQINSLKHSIDQALSKCHTEWSEKELEDRLKQEKIDISLPGRKSYLGRKHPLIQMIDEVNAILVGMGFSVQGSPEIESEYYNYGGLNYPPDHPARDMQDTFYLEKNILLRSHTTSIQQRIMETQKPPIRILASGKCYRNETITARSHVFFHQVDVLYIDKGVSFADLLATLEEFYQKVFKQKVEMRVRPSYFPFVEPGMEIDIKCTTCEGKGCPLCKQTGWLEVCGAGMVHPKVLESGGIDPEIYSGYAWGGGIERLFMLRHGIQDIRLFTENDMRFLSQF